MYPTPNMQSSADTEDKVQKVSPPRRKVSRDEKPEKPERPGNGSRIDVSSADSLSTSYKQQSTNSPNIKSIGTRQNELNSPPCDDISMRYWRCNAHSSKSLDAFICEATQIMGDPMSIRFSCLLESMKLMIFSVIIVLCELLLYHLDEMKLLAEVDQPGSLIDNYVTQLSFVLSRKAASLVSLQARQVPALIERAGNTESKEGTALGYKLHGNNQRGIYFYFLFTSLFCNYFKKSLIPLVPNVYTNHQEVPLSKFT
ncbi:hypothetical protein RDI58_001409 [Solanum bulbocastanum]|uniref:Uncharacterized protein n=1 Tax=Solanum bulbocastanum TaxID=147425 RepID=A0AAN8YPY1_SOLBU